MGRPALGGTEHVVVLLRLGLRQVDQVAHGEAPGDGVADRGDPHQPALLQHAAHSVEVGATRPGIAVRLIVGHGLRHHRAIRLPDLDVERDDAPVGHLAQPLGEMEAGTARIGHAQHQDLRVQGEHDPEAGAQVEYGQRRVHPRDHLGMASDGGEAVPIGSAPHRTRMGAGRLRDGSHLGRVAARVDDRVVLHLVDEREGRHHQRAALADHLQQRRDHRVAPAADPAERPHRRMDQHHVAVMQAGVPEPPVDLVPGHLVLIHPRAPRRSSSATSSAGIAPIADAFATSSSCSTFAAPLDTVLTATSAMI